MAATGGDGPLSTSRADLADVSTVLFVVANLTKAYLRAADLTGADLGGANVTGAYLRGANLTKANLSGVDLTRADLIGADRKDAKFLDQLQFDDAIGDENTRLPEQLDRPNWWPRMGKHG